MAAMAAKIANARGNCYNDNVLYQRFRQLYLDNAGSPYAALILMSLLEYADDTKDDGTYTRAWLYDAFEACLQHNCSDELKPTVEKLMRALLTPEVTLSFPNLTCNRQIPVTVQSVSGAEVELRVYPVKSGKNDYDGSSTEGSPISITRVLFKFRAPFKATKTVIVTLPYDGYFVIVPHVRNYMPTAESRRKLYLDPVHRTSILPVAVTDVATPAIVVMRADDGAPVPNAEVSPFAFAASDPIACTNGVGVAQFNLENLQTENIRVRIDNNSYVFRDCKLRSVKPSPTSAYYKANVLTDRTIYRPAMCSISWLCARCCRPTRVGTHPSSERACARVWMLPSSSETPTRKPLILCLLPPMPSGGRVADLCCPKVHKRASTPFT